MELQGNETSDEIENRIDLFIAESKGEIHNGYNLSRTGNNSLEDPEFRSYHNALSSAERADIKYIINTLANKSLIQLGLMKGSIDSAGDRIDHIHPLRFMEGIFTDEVCNVGIRNIKKRGGWVWSDFMSNTVSNFEEEMNHDNFHPDHVRDFAKKIKLDANLLLPLVEERKWSQFVETLIDKIEREGDFDRYNMRYKDL